MRRIFLVFLLFGLGAGQLKSESAEALYFLNLTTREGLNSNVTNSIVQDAYGFIWIGTQEGLCRFDGYNMKYFRSSSGSASLSSDNISCLLLEGDRLWVGTWDGLNVIDVKTFETRRLETGKARVIRTLFGDSDGNVWAGTSEGVLVYEKGQDNMYRITTHNSDLSHNMIRSFCQTPDGTVWIGTYDGLNRYMGGRISAYRLKGDYKPFIENNLVCALLPVPGAEDRLLWVGTETGLVSFDYRSGHQQHYNGSNTQFSNEVIKTIYAPNDSVLYLGTDFGLNVFHPKSGHNQVYYHDPLISSSIGSNVIWEIFEDRRQRLWFITSNGVSILNHGKPLYTLHETFFSDQAPRIGNQVRDVLVSKTGGIWLATIHGVIHHNNDFSTSTLFSADAPVPRRLLLDNVYALQEDKRGRIWIGTAGGLNVWDGHRNEMHAITASRENGLHSNYISNFILENDTTLWLVAWEGGLYKGHFAGDDPSDIIFTRIDEDGNGRVLLSDSLVYYASRNRLWTFTKNGKEKRSMDKINRVLDHRYISGIQIDEEGLLYVGLENALLRYAPASDRLDVVSLATGRPEKIMNLQVDAQGRIWASTLRTLLCIDADAGSYVTLPLQHYAPINSFYAYASTLASRRRLLVGGDNGFIDLDVQGFGRDTSKVSVLLTGLRLNNEVVGPGADKGVLKRDLAYLDELRLDYQQNSVTIEFSTLDYLFPAESQFAYRMLPLQEEWQRTSGKENFAVYANLRPGKYLFEVKGSSHLGTWSSVRRMQLEVDPPIWLSPAFIVLYLLLSILTLYVVFRLFTYRQRLNAELQLVRIEKQHSESIYQSRLQFFTNISHEFRTPLSLIIPPVKELLGSPGTSERQQRMLQIAHRNAQRLYKLVNQLLDFRKLEDAGLDFVPVKLNLVPFLENIFRAFEDMAMRHEIAYALALEQTELVVDVDAVKLETIVFNLLSNAFKHTPYGGKIVLSLALKEEVFEVSVSDNGVGIRAEEQQQIFEHFFQSVTDNKGKIGSGIGLTLAREYARMHGGDLRVESSPGAGSCFTLTLPLRNDPGVEVPAAGQIQEGLQFHVLTSRSESQQVPRNRRLVLVDDNSDILDYMVMGLDDSYELHTAQSGEAALELIHRVHPHLVISDVMMPGMDGRALCSRLKKDKTTAHLPVILLTAQGLDSQKTEGMEAGADLYLTKPVDMDYLRACIVGMFRRDEEMEAYFVRKLMLNPQGGEGKPLAEDELFLQKVMRIIEGQVSNPDLSVDSIAQEVGFSSTHLYRKLKEITGRSTKEIVVNYRMQKAADMLRHQEGNITEVMYAVGFSSLASFSRSFKSKYGVTPSAWAAGES
ncbi:two-component regulator propeller domain-containing protein [Geofilum rhodophaeum]|uniref:two-component regulator propeller domain-containing protein n=1 Tax=Geofilum rhodophaeum TaxID=1965019 RepID=UPI0013149B86|nr:two-component regulator propeller domain-containing protein [Geofilum rhodophaeum]